MQIIHSYVQFEITNRCNHHCIFCYNQHQVFAEQHKTIPLDQFQRIIDILVQNKVKIILTGGEPLLHPQIMELLNYLMEKKISVQINTNAVRLTQEIMSFIALAKVKLLVSLHGVGDIYNQIVGANTFELVKNNLKILREKYNIPVRLQFVPIKLNYLNFPQVAELAKDLGSSLQVARYTDPCGVDNLPQFGLNIDEYNSLFKLIVKIRKNRQIEVSLGNGIPVCLLDGQNITDDVLNLFNCGCSLGQGIWAISPSGDVRACPQLTTNVGNILKDTIFDIESAINKHYNSTKIIPLVCRECLLKNYCTGGCRSSALASTGFINGLDPLFPLNDQKREKNIQLLEEKIKRRMFKDTKDLLAKPIKLNDIIGVNKNISMTKSHLNGVIHLKGFGNQGLISQTLNETAIAIYQQFEKRKTLLEAITQLAEEYNVQPEEIQQDVISSVETLLRSGALIRD